MMLVQHMSVDPDWLSPPEDGDWLRSSLEDAAEWVDGRRLTVTSLVSYAREKFPEHTTELAVLSYIVHMGLPLEVEHMLRKLEQPNTDHYNV